MDEWVDSEYEDSPRSIATTDEGAQFPQLERKQWQSYGTQHHNYGEHLSVLPSPQPDYIFQAKGPPSVSSASTPSVANSATQRRASQLRNKDQKREIMAKKQLIRRVQKDSMKNLLMKCHAVAIRGPAGNYYVYHIEISNDFYKQKWVVCKRYSEFYNLRKRLLGRLSAHKKRKKCRSCGNIEQQLRAFSFPKKYNLFADANKLMLQRTNMLEEFIVALCQYLVEDDMLADTEMNGCNDINTTRYMVKEFLQFPLEHENQHTRALWQLSYVDLRDVSKHKMESENCPICLSEWRELDGSQLVVAPCGHYFHEHCINEWYRSRFDCPMCRTVAGL